MKNNPINKIKSLLLFEEVYFSRFEGEKNFCEIKIKPTKNYKNMWEVLTYFCNKPNEFNEVRAAGTLDYCFSIVESLETQLLNLGFRKEDI
jgi:hypothetical protein